jgi:hypothetical protein
VADILAAVEGRIWVAVERRIWVAVEHRISAVEHRIWAAERHTLAAARHISAAVARISVRLISEAVIRVVCRTSLGTRLHIPISRTARRISPVTPGTLPDQLSTRMAAPPGGSLM